MRLIDVRHLGRERVIGCWQLDEVLIDPGPESAMDALLEGLGDWQPRALLLTHIHLDHAGATGALVRRWPDVDVYVHEIGAPHLADPTKLLSSAERLYGDRMQELWGDVLPVPETSIKPLSGSENVLGFEVAYTPGHASHHVSFLHTDSGRAFVGDVAGVRIPPCNLVLPPTPPPDVDLPAWNGSLDLLSDWEPTALVPTHFNVIHDPGPHIGLLRSRLEQVDEITRAMTLEEYVSYLRRWISGECDEEAVTAYNQVMQFDHQWLGLKRYFDSAPEG